MVGSFCVGFYGEWGGVWCGVLWEMCGGCSLRGFVVGLVGVVVEGVGGEGGVG